jgi:sugar phosphate isomerase/epimerase
VLRAIHAAGYTEVETFGGSYTRPARELRSMITDAGLTVPAGHFNYTEFEQRIAYAKELGVEYMICPMIPETQWNAAGFLRAAADYNRWAHTLHSEGLRFAHHNHDYEWKSLENGRTGWSVLVGETDPELVGLELDCYWALQAGQDPMVLVKALRDRIHLLHLKDREAGAPTSFDMGAGSQHFAEMGKGTIDWKPLIQQAQSQGVRYFFLDQDRTAGPPLESAQRSFRYLQALGV